MSNLKAAKNAKPDYTSRTAHSLIEQGVCKPAKRRAA